MFPLSLFYLIAMMSEVMMLGGGRVRARSKITTFPILSFFTSSYLRKTMILHFVVIIVLPFASIKAEVKIMDIRNLTTKQSNFRLKLGGGGLVFVCIGYSMA